MAAPTESSGTEHLIGNDDNPFDRWLTFETTMDRLRVAERTLYRLIADGRITVIKHAGQLFFEPEAVAEYFRRVRTEAEQERADAEAERLARSTRDDQANPR